MSAGKTAAAFHTHMGADGVQTPVGRGKSAHPLAPLRSDTMLKLDVRERGYKTEQAESVGLQLLETLTASKEW